MNWEEQKYDLKTKERKVGRPKALDSPEQLWNLACEYFAEVDKNPFKEEDFIRGGASAGDIVKLNKMRPYTWQGFDNFLFLKGIVWNLSDYRANRNNAYSEFSEVITQVNQIIYNQKFEGAAVGAFNHNIIARDLGLTDKSEHTVKEQPLFPDAPSQIDEDSDLL